FAIAALAIYTVSSHPSVLAQNGAATEHWVGTWATALVARAQTPPGGQAQGRGAAAAGQPAQGQAPPAAAPPPAQAPQQAAAPQGQNAPAAPAAGRGGAPPLNF